MKNVSYNENVMKNLYTSTYSKVLSNHASHLLELEWAVSNQKKKKNSNVKAL